MVVLADDSGHLAARPRPRPRPRPAWDTSFFRDVFDAILERLVSDASLELILVSSYYLRHQAVAPPTKACFLGAPLALKNIFNTTSRAASFGIISPSEVASSLCDTTPETVVVLADAFGPFAGQARLVLRPRPRPRPRTAWDTSSLRDVFDAVIEILVPDASPENLLVS